MLLGEFDCSEVNGVANMQADIHIRENTANWLFASDYKLPDSRYKWEFTFILLIL